MRRNFLQVPSLRCERALSWWTFAQVIGDYRRLTLLHAVLHSIHPQ
jgi:hypothetical protein